MSGKETKSQKQKASSQKVLFMPLDSEAFKPYKVVRIAVSGDVILNRTEIEIIDTRDFQRLRGIKALGSTYTVFPTAVHTRFDHSLGTLAMASEMVKEIRKNQGSTEEEKKIEEEEEILIRTYALLHDICHIPFGHTLEDEFCIFPKHDEDFERIDRFLGPESDIGRVLTRRLGSELHKRFMSIITVEKKNIESLGNDAFIYDIVSNTVCADLLDYLRRDCYFCNISLDMDYRFLKHLYLSREGSTRRVVIRLWKEGKTRPRRDLLSELVRLLDNRYLLAERVYYHHSKLISGTMIAGAVQRMVMDGELKKEDMYEIGDETLIDKLEASENPNIRRLVSSLREQKKWKQVYQRDLNAIAAEQSKLRDLDIIETLMEKWWENADNRTKEENFIAEAAGADPGDVLIYCPSSKMSMKLAKMKVFWNGNCKPLEDCKDDPVIKDKLSMILKSHESLWAIRSFINPDYLDRADVIVNACKQNFIFEPGEREGYKKQFYRNMVSRITGEEGYSESVLHANYLEKEDKIVKLLSSDTSGIKNISTIKSLIKDAFTK